MNKILLLLSLSLIVSLSCSRDKNEDTYEIINKLIDYQLKSNKVTIIDTSEMDTIKFGDFLVGEKPYDNIVLSNIDKQKFFGYNGYTSRAFSYDSYFDLKDTSFINDQISAREFQIWDSTKIRNVQFALYPDSSSRFYILKLCEKYGKDILLISEPVFNRKKNKVLICYIYLTKFYQFDNYVFLLKNNNKWVIKTNKSVVGKFVWKNNIPFSGEVEFVFKGIKERTYY